MGAAQSTTSAVSNSVTRAVAQTILRSTQNCAAAGDASQTVDVGGSGNVVSGIDQTQSISVNLSCLGKADTIAQLQADIANSITQSVNQESVALLSSLGMPTAEVRSNIATEVKNVFTQETIQNCASALKGSQGVKVTGEGNVVSGITQKQALESMTQCVSENVQRLSTVMAAINQVDQTAVNKSENPLAFIGDLFGGFSSIGMAIAAVVGLIVIVIIAAMFRSSGPSATDRMMQNIQMMQMMSAARGQRG